MQNSWEIIILEIVFARAAPAFDNLFMGCVFNINTVHKTVEKLTFQAVYWRRSNNVHWIFQETRTNFIKANRLISFQNSNGSWNKISTNGLKKPDEYQRLI